MTKRYCQWCAVRDEKKHMFKVRDGPVDWRFCSEDHAAEYVAWRHRSLEISRHLKRIPQERQVVGHEATLAWCKAKSSR